MLEFIEEYGVMILSLVVTVISLVVSFIKSKLNHTSKGMLDLLATIPYLVKQAEEEYGAGKGKQKFNYVITQVMLYALQNGIKLDKDLVEEHIEAVVDATNNVNTDKKPTPKEATVEGGTSAEANAVATQDTLNI